MHNKLKKKIASRISSINPFFSEDSFALTYHSINDKNHELTSKLYQLPVNSFKEQINYLSKNNFISQSDHEMFHTQF